MIVLPIEVRLALFKVMTLLLSATLLMVKTPLLLITTLELPSAKPLVTDSVPPLMVVMPLKLALVPVSTTLALVAVILPLPLKLPLKVTVPVLVMLSVPALSAPSPLNIISLLPPHGAVVIDNEVIH